MKKIIIDRFEGGYAICEKEDKSIIQIPKYQLPPSCREGECLTINTSGMYQKDTDEYKVRENRIRKKLNRLFG